MIDNYKEAMELLHQMEAQLPIPVYPSPGLVQSMKTRGVTLDPNQALSIKHVLYLGDEGGIMCDITPAGQQNAIICSLTNLQIAPAQPLGEAIQAYQQRRIKRLAASGGPKKPVPFTVKPRKKR